MDLDLCSTQPTGTLASIRVIFTLPLICIPLYREQGFHHEGAKGHSALPSRCCPAKAGAGGPAVGCQLALLHCKQLLPAHRAIDLQEVCQALKGRELL